MRFSDYADYKLHELEILSEIRRHIEEVYQLREQGFVEGPEIDAEIEKMEAIYEDLLKKANEIN
jgi:hypothetical protein